MLLCKVVLIVFLFILSNKRVYAVEYVFPEAQIQAFAPKGISISIIDVPAAGIQQVEFHFSINKKIVKTEQADFFKNVQHKHNGRWTFIKRKVKLRIGDVVNYRLFVITNRLGYSRYGDPFVVKELIPATCEVVYSPRNCRKPHRDPTQQTTSPPQMPNTTSTGKEADSIVKMCDEIIVNATQALISLQYRVEKLMKTNHQLTTAMEKYPDAKKLKLSGRIPPDDETMMVVRFILYEKLDLLPNIVSTVRNDDNSITFEVATLAEKFDILEEAKEKLKYSKIFIS